MGARMRGHRRGWRARSGMGGCWDPGASVQEAEPCGEKAPGRPASTARTMTSAAMSSPRLCESRTMS